MLAIYKKELRSYFTSMVGYVFIAFFLVIIGIYFYLQNLYSRYANFEYSLTGITFIFILLVPLITMRLMAEENRQKTDQLLFTSPLTAGSIVMGKFLAVFTVFGTVMAITCFYPLIIKQFGNVPLDSAYASIFGFVMLGGTYLAIGLFISSLTESQVIAAVISFFVFLLTLLLDFFAEIVPGDNRTSFIIIMIAVVVLCLVLYHMMRNLILSIAMGVLSGGILLSIYLWKPVLFDGIISKSLRWLSVISRYYSFSFGILDFADMIYYLSIMVLFLFLTTQVIKKKRWS